MKPNLGKVIRTLQSECYFLKDIKDSFYYNCRKLLRRPHDNDFSLLKFIPDSLPGSYLDVGANQGQSIESIKIFKPSAQIYSFEANRNLAGRLEKRYLGRNDVTIMPFGLAEVAEDLKLFVPVYKKFVYDGLASFDSEKAASWLGAETLHFFSPSSLELRETISSTERLDDLNLNPLFIKIDVQGYEYNVIKGALETIKRCDPILMIEDFTGPLVELVRELGYEQYLFNDSGFYRADSTQVVNAILMRPSRHLSLN